MKRFELVVGIVLERGPLTSLEVTKYSEGRISRSAAPVLCAYAAKKGYTVGERVHRTGCHERCFTTKWTVTQAGRDLITRLQAEFLARRKAEGRPWQPPS